VGDEGGEEDGVPLRGLLCAKARRRPPHGRLALARRGGLEQPRLAARGRGDEARASRGELLRPVAAGVDVAEDLRALTLLGEGHRPQGATSLITTVILITMIIKIMMIIIIMIITIIPRSSSRS
jgi:hypothetical protein